MRISEQDVDVETVIRLVHEGQVEKLEQFLESNPGMVAATIVRGGEKEFTYPLMNVATDWPGNFPRVGESIRVMAVAGADVNARCGGAHRESPLHGAASSNDIEAVTTLVELGADIEADGAVIAGGTPLDDAVAFGQWDAARLLVRLGAETNLWHACALGLLERVEAYFANGEPAAKHPWGSPESRPRDIGFWAACHGGQLEAAKLLLARGADPEWLSPWDQHTPLDAARRSNATDVIQWLTSLDA